MLTVYTEIFSIVRLKIIVASSHVVGKSFTINSMPIVTYRRSPFTSVTLLARYIFFVQNFIYMFVTYNQTPVLTSKIPMLQNAI